MPSASALVTSWLPDADSRRTYASATGFPRSSVTRPPSDPVPTGRQGRGVAEIVGPPVGVGLGVRGGHVGIDGPVVLGLGLGDVPPAADVTRPTASSAPTPTARVLDRTVRRKLRTGTPSWLRVEHFSEHGSASGLPHPLDRFRSPDRGRSTR